MKITQIGYTDQFIHGKDDLSRAQLRQMAKDDQIFCEARNCQHILTDAELTEGWICDSCYQVELNELKNSEVNN